MVTQSKAKDVLNILKNAETTHECETDLVNLLGPECFDFIKILKKHRQMSMFSLLIWHSKCVLTTNVAYFRLVLYCTLLASSQSEDERQKIRDKMRSDESLARILRQLDQEDDEEQSSNARTTRRSEQLQESSESIDGQVTGHRKTLDLDDLVFQDGSHFMSNKKCQLPDGSFRKQRKGNFL